MKAIFKYIFIAGFCAGCTTSPIDESSRVDTSFRQIRHSMRDEAVPYPILTPFDATPAERDAYMEGYKQGWNTAIDQWLGAMLCVPEKYQKPERMMGAWKKGNQDGTLALYNAVQKKALKSSTSPASHSPTSP
jgi:hypothetical protein